LQEAVKWLEGIHAPFVISQVGSSVLTWWYSLDDSRSATAAIIGINTLVYLAWRVPSPRLQMLMFRSFMHYPGQTSSYTLLTSVFSHMVREAEHPSEMSANSFNRASCISPSI
jgi:hypothetical protein